ncbi:MAG: riboflavin synthase [Bacteroidetes bacterium]|nr:riboflavin synthase [Bacteroidota bacterium]
MFTGIVEAIGLVQKTKKESGNIRITIQCPFTHELKVDQSICHNGVCLTVTGINGNEYEVVAIEETISRTNFGILKTGDEINLERSMKLGDRLDGHIVQGHVDETATVKKIDEHEGSSVFTFEYKTSSHNITVEKGSVCVNGVSLTVVDSGRNWFSVAIIPYTFEHTNFHSLKPGDAVNLEFDVIGKYISRLMAERK